jgi:hypothetical protein
VLTFECFSEVPEASRGNERQREVSSADGDIPAAMGYLVPNLI